MFWRATFLAQGFSDLQDAIRKPAGGAVPHNLNNFKLERTENFCNTAITTRYRIGGTLIEVM
jgi:hypothetical protein